MNRILILFDCPDETNDKRWLYDNLNKMYLGEVDTISISETLSTLSRRYGIKGRIKTYLIMLEQARRASKNAKNGDTIITWSHAEGLITNLLIRKKSIRLISMNWLTPSHGEFKVRFLEKLLIANKNAAIIVNSPDSPERWKRYLQLSSIDRFFVVPDVYDSNISFDYKIWKREKKYCFTGGMNNRDWKMIAHCAMSIPDCQFICVGLKKDFDAQMKETVVPENMSTFFDISSEQYYKLMKNAYLVLIPLLSNKVAGLINILRSAQSGVPCLITNTPATRQYYPMELEDMLVSDNQEEWISKVKDWISLDYKEYSSKVTHFMKNIDSNFSPYNASIKILDIINRHHI